jgi:hypothetical protein
MAGSVVARVSVSCVATELSAQPALASFVVDCSQPELVRVTGQVVVPRRVLTKVTTMSMRGAGTSTDQHRPCRARCGARSLRRSRRWQGAIGHDAKAAAAFDAVGLEIVVVDREDRAERLAASQVHKSGIGEVHRPVMVAGHQAIERGKISIIDRRNGHRPGAKKPPRRRDLGPPVSDEMEELGQHRCGSEERQPQAGERADAGLMPAIVAVKQRKDRTRINECARACGRRHFYGPLPARTPEASGGRVGSLIATQSDRLLASTALRQSPADQRARLFGPKRAPAPDGTEGSCRRRVQPRLLGLIAVSVASACGQPFAHEALQ